MLSSLPADREAVPASAIVGALTITVLDGFDAFSLSLMAPLFSRDLSIPTASLGPIFAIAMAGMIVGATTGGVLADKFGRLGSLLVAFALFAMAAATMPFVDGVSTILVNRFVAGMGLGAAAPLAVSLLNRAGAQPSDFVVSLVWSGIPIGGGLAALFNYLVVPDLGWRSIFWVGAVLPMPTAIFAWRVFRTRKGSIDARRAIEQPRLASLFAGGQAWVTVATAGMFFFGYVTTAIVVNWLPTVLTERDASPAIVSLAFGAMTAGGVVGTLVLGWVAVRRPQTRTWAWGIASLCGLVASVAALGTASVAVMAIVAATFGAGAQALSVAFSNTTYRDTGLQTTSIGLMTGVGRIGQFAALGISGLIVAISGDPIFVFGLVALAAALATAFSLVASRSARRVVPSRKTDVVSG